MNNIEKLETTKLKNPEITNFSHTIKTINLKLISQTYIYIYI
jgi:hypothetical protein